MDAGKQERNPIGKAVLVLNSDAAAWRSRRRLIIGLIARGIQVIVVTPGGPYVPKLIEVGTKHVAVSMHRFVGPLRDLRLFFDLYRLFRRERPDIVHTMTVKPNIFGGLAAHLARVPRVVALISGLGYVFLKGRSWKQRMLRYIVSLLYRRVCNMNARVWFQNPDDISLFVESGLITRDKAVLIRGSGVNLQEYSSGKVGAGAIPRLRAELGIDASTQVVLMSSRAIWSKGVREFVEASEYAARWGLPVIFVLSGALAPGAPDSVPEIYLRSKSSPHFKWLGFRQDMRELLSLADVVTLPSYYREGVPRSLLEGLAMGKPIVTTDNVGCREVVDQGVNGFLVPVQDARALASAIGELIRDDLLRALFGRNSRAKAEAEFDEAVVVRRVLKEVYGLNDESQDKGETRFAAA
jgi:N,N'-diacetylbacillosaminyl-diphospho-undecaprenol alpha-1,3-N-acetylgalactosaminyltransferase